MAEGKSGPDGGVNWPMVGFATIALLVVVAIVPNTLLRTACAAIIMIATIYVAQSRQEPEIENPLLDQLHATHREGLDRRKYGRLRTHTDRLLENIRQMNRLAVEGREGKIAPRHAQAELDRIAEMMKEMVDEIRKTAGVPTPQGGPDRKSAQPQIVMPRPADEPEPGEQSPPTNA